MNLNPVEWSEAQNLLIKLVQVLSPLSVREIPHSVFLNQRFVMPSSYPSASLRHPVVLLSTLREVQKEVAQWLNDPKIEEGEKEETAPTPNKKELARAPMRTLNPPEKEALPLVSQAKELIQQVQEAIGRLSHSSYIQDPKEAPLLVTLKELKPKLDQIIETVSNSSSPESPTPSSSLRPIPVTSREELFRKFHSLEERPLPIEPPRSEMEEVTQAKKKGDRALPTSPLPSAEIPKKRGQPLEKEGIDLIPKLKNRGKGEFDPTVLLFSEEKKREIVVQKIEQRPVALPIIPIVFQPKRIVLNRKKKKQKDFLSRDDEEKS